MGTEVEKERGRGQRCKTQKIVGELCRTRREVKVKKGQVAHDKGEMLVVDGAS